MCKQSRKFFRNKNRWAYSLQILAQCISWGRLYEKEGIDYFEKKKMLLLTKEELKSYQDPKVCYIWWKKILQKLAKNKNYWKVRDHFYYTGKYSAGSHSICNLKFNVLKEIRVVFRNGSNYDYHFFIKELANEFERKFECLWLNTEMYKIFLFQ